MTEGKQIINAESSNSFFILFACGPSAKEKAEKAKQDSIAKIDSIKNNYVGEWKNVAPRGNSCFPGDPTALKIYKDGDLFIIDETCWSTLGRDYGTFIRPRAFTATYKDGSLEISNGFGMKITYGASSKHIFLRNQEFTK